MKLMIDKMRADFALVVATRISSGVWDKGDEVAAGGAIRRAIDANDEEVVLTWSRWLAKLALQDLLEVAQACTQDRSCADCRHVSKKGSDDGRCKGRAALAKIYGTQHPLSVLPADGAVSCARFLKANA